MNAKLTVVQQEIWDSLTPMSQWSIMLRRVWRAARWLIVLAPLIVWFPWAAFSRSIPIPLPHLLWLAAVMVVGLAIRRYRKLRGVFQSSGSLQVWSALPVDNRCLFNLRERDVYWADVWSLVAIGMLAIAIASKLPFDSASGLYFFESVVALSLWLGVIALADLASIRAWYFVTILPCVMSLYFLALTLIAAGGHLGKISFAFTAFAVAAFGVCVATYRYRRRHFKLHEFGFSHNLPQWYSTEPVTLPTEADKAITASHDNALRDARDFDGQVMASKVWKHLESEQTLWLGLSNRSWPARRIFSANEFPIVTATWNSTAWSKRQIANALFAYIILLSGALLVAWFTESLFIVFFAMFFYVQHILEGYGHQRNLLTLPYSLDKLVWVHAKMYGLLGIGLGVPILLIVYVAAPMFGFSRVDVMQTGLRLAFLGVVAMPLIAMSILLGHGYSPLFVRSLWMFLMILIIVASIGIGGVVSLLYASSLVAMIGSGVVVLFSCLGILFIFSRWYYHGIHDLAR